MKEKAPEIIYRAYVDYGIVVLVAVAGVLAVWLLLRYIKSGHEKRVTDLEEKLEHCSREMKRISEIVDHTNDVVTENSKALYENASITNEVKGILIILNSKLK